MIIDFHTHAFPDALAKRAIDTLLSLSEGKFPLFTDATAKGLLAYMDECGIDKSVLQPIVTKEKQLVSLNEWAVSLKSDRIIPFGGIYPSSPDYKAAIDFVYSLGLRGLKLHPEYQNFVVDAPELLPVYDYALSRGMTLLFHAGYDPAFKPPFRSSAKQFANVLDAMRGGTIVLAHMGGHGSSEWVETERYLFGRDVYFDTSMGFAYRPNEVFLRFVEKHGAEKILFGTDSPWSDAKVELAGLREIPITGEQRELIFNGNAKRILGL